MKMGVFMQLDILMAMQTMTQVMEVMLTGTGTIYNGFIAKYDSYGNFIRVLQIKGTKECFVNTIASDSLGNIYVCGTYRDSVVVDPSNNQLIFTTDPNHPYQNDFFVSKYASNGSLIWAKSFGGGGDDIAMDITASKNGDIYLTGWLSDSFTVRSGGSFTDTFYCNSQDAFLLKLNTNGVIQYLKQFKGTGNEGGRRLCIDHDFVYIAGSIQGGHVYFDSTMSQPLNSIGGLGDIFITKFSLQGNYIWSKIIGGKGYEEPQSITVDQGGNVLTVGGFTDTVDFDPGVSVYNLFSHRKNAVNTYFWDNGFISKLDKNGDFIWAKVLNGVGRTVFNSIVCDTKNNYYIAGQYEDTTDFDFGNGTNYYVPIDTSKSIFFVLSIDSLANMNWIRNIIEIGFAYRNYFLTIDKNNNIYAAGNYRGTNDFNIGYSPPMFVSAVYGDDCFFLKMNTWPLSVSQYANEPMSQLEIYPNPAISKFQIKNAKYQSKKELYNSVGQLILTTKENEIDVSRFAKGMYYLRCDGMSKKVIIE